MELIRCSEVEKVAVGDIGLICGSSVKQLMNVTSINRSDTSYPLTWGKLGSTYGVTTTTMHGRWLCSFPDGNKDISFIVRFTDEERNTLSEEELRDLAANSAEELFAEAQRKKVLKMKKNIFFGVVSLIYLISIIVSL